MALAWDPEIDTPATIAVLGGGPVGVEAALYARFLGYFVMLFDSAKVGHGPLAWGGHSLPATWQEVTTPLGLAALEAQGHAAELPAADQRLTYRDYVDKYLLPVARTDLLYESIHINSKVRSVSRTGCTPTLPTAVERRAEQEFRLLIASQQRGEYTQLADIVLDCSGLGARRQGLASGTGLAINETELAPQMQLGKVDVLGKRRARFAGKHTLQFGCDWAACANALDFAELANQVEGTRLTWVLPKHIGGDSSGLRLAATLPSELAAAARQLCDAGNPAIVPMSAWGIESLQFEEGWQVRLQTGEEETLDVSCDEFVNSAEALTDWSFVSGLNLAGTSEADLVTAEPHYYVLGQKATGEGSVCSFGKAQEQIRRVFALIGGRADLDLYAIVKAQNSP